MAGDAPAWVDLGYFNPAQIHFYSNIIIYFFTNVNKNFNTTLPLYSKQVKCKHLYDRKFIIDL